MPKEIYTKDYPFLKAGSRLSFQQMVSIAKGFISLGVEKVRLTGGEPLLRKDIEKLVEALARLATPDGRPVEIVLTTNGTPPCGEGAGIKGCAGLAGVTVSLDSLDDAVFRHMNDVGFPVGKVLDGIEAARNAGIDTVKVNTVIEKGVNDSQILPLAKYFRHGGVTPRFIEFMDVGGAESWSMQRVLRSEDVRDRIAQAYPWFLARDFAAAIRLALLYADGGGEVGFISSVSKPFCGDCTRARVSADGRMFLCLFAERGVDLRQWLTESTSPEALRDAIRSRWERRDDRYSELRTERLARNGKKSYPTVRMSLVGG
ncbi:GTP 3',8-cyclase MoaA [Cupriavidus basilensis]